MKTLTAFWHWVDNEKPAEVAEKHLEPVSYQGQRALGIAQELLLERLDASFDDYDDEECVDLRAFNGLRDHWPAIRDLSFVICRGIEAMHEAVPEPEPFTPTAEAFLAERYRDEVPLPDVVMNGSKAFACPGCGLQQCNGSHVDCDMEAYLAANPTVRARLTGPSVPVLCTTDGADKSWFQRLNTDGLQPLRSEPGEALFRREYMGGWLTEQQQAEQSRRNTEMQLAAQGQTVYLGQQRSNYNSITREIVVFTSVTVEELNAFRGLRPNRIVLRGKPDDYQARTREAMGSVLWPMHRDGAVVVTRDYYEPPSAFFQP